MIRINLLPVREIKAVVGRRQDLVIAGLSLALTATLLLGLYLFQSHRLSSLGKELADLRRDIEVLNVKAQGMGELRKNIVELKDKLRVIEELRKKRTGPVRVMESLSSATPSRLWLTEFKESGGNVTINGVAIDNQTIADFLKALATYVYFKNVDLVETAQIEQEGVRLKKFSIRAQLVYQPPPPPAQKAATTVPPKAGGT